MRICQINQVVPPISNKKLKQITSSWQSKVLERLLRHWVTDGEFILAPKILSSSLSQLCAVASNVKRKLSIKLYSKENSNS